MQVLLVLLPPSPSRCAECTVVPESCGWSKGLYPGVLLLYLQEIAVNVVLTQEEWDSQPPRLLDQSSNHETKSTCEPALLHC